MKKKQLAVVAVSIPRENIDWIEEWVMHHIKLGASKVVLYDNTGSTGSDRWSSIFAHTELSLSGIDKRGRNYKEETKDISDSEIIEYLTELEKKTDGVFERVVWQPIGKRGNIVHGQAEAYADFIRKNKDVYEWGAFIDVDEFIRIQDGHSLINTLESSPSLVSSIHLMNIRSKKLHAYPKGSIPDTIPVMSVRASGYPKTLARLNKIHGSNVHVNWSTEGTHVIFPSELIHLIHFNGSLTEEYERTVNWKNSILPASINWNATAPGIKYNEGAAPISI